MRSERVRKEAIDRTERNSVRSRQGTVPNTQNGDHSILTLQRTLGNQAVQDLHRRGELPPFLESTRPVDVVDRESEQGEETEGGMWGGESTAPRGEGAATMDGVETKTEGDKVEPETATEAEPEPEAEPTSDEMEAGEPETGAAEAAPAGETAPTSPEADPAFQAVVEQIETVATREQAHPPAEAASADAQAAAEGPENEVESKAAAAQVGEMAEQEPGEFDKEGFKQALSKKIEQIAPKTLKQADEFKENNELESVKGDLVGRVEQEKEQSQQPIKEKVEETPDTSGVQPKPTTTLEPPTPGSPPPNVGATRAAPKPKTEAEISAPFQERSQELDGKLESEGITETQLQNANEPTFTEALQSKQEAQSHAAQAPNAYRQHEQGVLSGAKAEAETAAQTRTEGMHGDRSQLLDSVEQIQNQTKSEDEQERAAIATKFQAIYNDTKEKVDTRLAQLDTDVNEAFDDGAAAAREVFEEYVDQRMSAYKARRYGQFGGGALWIKDQFMDLPDEVNQFYVEGRNLYLEEMDKVLDRVVAIVETGLLEAKGFIVAGRQEINEEVEKLPESLKAVGQEAASDIGTQFDQLEQTVDEKKDQLIDSLARKYTEKLQEVDARIEELKAENEGLFSKAFDAVAGVVQTITQLKDLLLGVLSKAAAAVQTIIQDPIGFLGNLVDGVKQGFQNFVSNIWTHLQTGLIEWLTGTLTQAGVQLPEQWDLKGIFSFVMQILGLTYENIRAQAVKVLGEETVSALEKAFEIFKVLVTEGVAGLWTYVQDKIGDLKAMVLDKIRELVITQVIEAGIKWILGLLSPVGAFIKACKAIYDIVTFFFERARQVLTLVDAVLDSILAIAQGNLAGAAKFVEDALARSVPVLIGFLANLLGLGDLPEKIHGVIEAIQAPINKAIQWVIERAKEAVQRLGAALFGKKDAKGETPKTDDPEHDAKVAAGLSDIDREERRFVERGTITREEAEQVAATVQQRHPVFQSISVIDGGDRWDYRYVASEGTYQGEEKDELLVVSVADVEPPGRSAIGQLAPASPEVLAADPDDEHAPSQFERDVGRSVAETLGVSPVRPGTKSRWPAKTRTQTGLPSDPRLLAEPKTNLGGVARADDIFKRPDFVALTPAGKPQVEVFEVTLDAGFSIPEGTRGSPSHKQVQIAGTIFAIAQRYPNVPIIYNIRATADPTDAARRELESILREARGRGTDVQIIWRTG